MNFGMRSGLLNFVIIPSFDDAFSFHSMSSGTELIDWNELPNCARQISCNADGLSEYFLCIVSTSLFFLFLPDKLTASLLLSQISSFSCSLFSEASLDFQTESTGLKNDDLFLGNPVGMKVQVMLDFHMPGAADGISSRQYSPPSPSPSPPPLFLYSLLSSFPIGPIVSYLLMVSYCFVGFLKVPQGSLGFFRAPQGSSVFPRFP